nr:ABC transporter permease [Saprospiraceae bacterium]
MNKLWLIIKREYLSRVKTKSFILTTILGPLAIGFFIVIVGFIFSYQSDDAKQIVIIDEADMLEGKLKDTENFYFTFSQEPYTDVLADQESAGYDAILVIPPLRE